MSQRVWPECGPTDRLREIRERVEKSWRFITDFAALIRAATSAKLGRELRRESALGWLVRHPEVLGAIRGPVGVRLGAVRRASKGDGQGSISFEGRGACHRAGHFGPDPLAATSGLTTERKPRTCRYRAVPDPV